MLFVDPRGDRTRSPGSSSCSSSTTSICCAPTIARSARAGRSVLARGQPLGRPRAVPVRVRERAPAPARRARAPHRLAVPAVRRATSCRGSRSRPRARSSTACCRCRASPRIRRSPMRWSQGIDRAASRCSPRISRSPAMAMRDLQVTSRAALAKLGGPQRARVGAGCTRRVARPATSARRCGCAPSSPRPAHGPRPASRDPPDQPRPAFAQHGVQHARAARRDRRAAMRRGTTWMLRHEVLTPRVRELTAPARAAARRGFDLLGSQDAEARAGSSSASCARCAPRASRRSRPRSRTSSTRRSATT